MSITSGCAANMPCAGFISAKVAPVTAIMMKVAISISTSVKPASRPVACLVIALSSFSP